MVPLFACKISTLSCNSKLFDSRIIDNDIEYQRTNLIMTGWKFFIHNHSNFSTLILNFNNHLEEIKQNTFPTSISYLQSLLLENQSPEDNYQHHLHILCTSLLKIAPTSIWMDLNLTNENGNSANKNQEGHILNIEFLHLNLLCFMLFAKSNQGDQEILENIIIQLLKWIKNIVKINVKETELVIDSFNFIISISNKNGHFHYPVLKEIYLELPITLRKQVMLQSHKYIQIDNQSNDDNQNNNINNDNQDIERPFADDIIAISPMDPDLNQNSNPFFV